MSKSKKKLGALGPQPHWLRMSQLQRERTKQYIKEGLQGYTRPDGVKIPSARDLFRHMNASDGFDLRHIERWSAQKLASARQRVQAINTLTSRPFDVLHPRTHKQIKSAKTYTGQDMPQQKGFVVQVQNMKMDTATFRQNKVVVEREFKNGSKQVEQRFLFRDYNNGKQPITFPGMRRSTERMMKEMPEKYRGSKVYYTLITAQYGPIGRSIFKERLLEELSNYHSQYGNSSMHRHFAEQVIGYQMVGTYAQAAKYQIEREHLPAHRKKMKKLRFAKPLRCQHVDKKTHKQCVLPIRHKSHHRYAVRKKK